MIDPQWLSAGLLVPVVGLLIGIKSDLAGLKATQTDHGRRLDRLEVPAARS